MILLIDSYDSFTNNLANLIKATTEKEVILVHNDSFQLNEYESFYNQIKNYFDFIVIGPGPGHPAIKEDVGIISWLFHRIAKDTNGIPILGICLGFQSLCHEFGNKVETAEHIRHGQIYDIFPAGENDIYKNTEKFPSVRYHSLYVDGTKLNGEIIPLAYCYEPVEADPDKGQILMAAKHKSLPFYGVQYHPESICSNKGKDLFKNFTEIANEYNSRNGRNVSTCVQNEFQWFDKHALHERSLIEEASSTEPTNVLFEKVELPENITAVDVCDHFVRIGNGKIDFSLLNSASVPGEWSIIGFPIEGESEIISHSVDDMNHVYTNSYKSSERKKFNVDGHEGAWKFIAQKMYSKYISRDSIKRKINSNYNRELPFFGGYIGLISYEEGQHICFNKLKPICTSTTPDIKLMYVSRVLIRDHLTNEWFLLSINDKDDNWVKDIQSKLKDVKPIDLSEIASSVKDLCKDKDKDSISFEYPSQEIYRQQFDKCQEYLHSGDSYELCLTTQSKIKLPKYVTPWNIYKVLTLKKNPSPFSCFVDFDDCCLISSSPERFLSWKDERNGKGKLIQLRPIKGTVKNTEDVNFEKASKILKTPKEMGENLMIVDLIRHDLFQFTSDVEVTQLMAVEEYKTVFQLVSVIEGKLKENDKYFGIDILHRSLPPGSMTGAPKKRSVELLQDIESMQPNINEGGRRGIYSGVVGYWSVTDDSDWSVIIRSVFHYKDDIENSNELNLWRIGAGGAITVLSDVDGEWDEMNLKLSSALQAFN
ncbi:ABZ1 [Candida pseudojiufengensis]|uniref:ABZ1 n=1 Tax=Candida pseudojiufengensis TaxID=497109 RepID=UPI0022245615|nr:ABZ1 [Candida pseudojiufengensis]KAI5965547.1 ABZ1 [Candida pseudojiufengensis]